jgi:hypothetical protein
MQAASMHAAPEDVRAFVQEYFGAWKGTDENKILAYYSDDIVLQLPTGTLSATTLSVPLSPASPATSMQYATRRTRAISLPSNGALKPFTVARSPTSRLPKKSNCPAVPFTNTTSPSASFLPAASISI